VKRTILGTVFFGIMATSRALAADPVQLTFASPHGEAMPVVATFKEFFGPEVTKRTNGQVTFKYLAGGSLAKGGEELEAVQSGIADIATIVLPYYSGQIPLGSFGYWLPFGPTDPATVIKATRQLAQDMPELPQSIEAYNQKILYWASFADYNLVSTFPVATIDDLEGKKVSVVGINAPWFSSIGMEPVTTYVAEDYIALQTGVFEAETLMWDLIYILKLYEPAPYATITHLGAPLGYAITINNDRWAKLSPEIQNVILEVAAEAEAETVKRLHTDNEKAVDAMKAAGTKFVELPPEEIARWVAALDEIPAMRGKEADERGLPGTKLIQRYIELTEEAGFKYPRQWKFQ
jgi:TRAP-type C4-dicarboxylate transport system substrate-binding protein